MCFKLNKLAVYPAIIVIGLFLACSGGKKNDKGSGVNKDLKESSQKDKFQEQVNRVKIIFYNIPSPLEMSDLMQRANLDFNADILNPLDNIDKYTSTKNKALNLGVYGADLSYARLYDQIQESINYLAGIRKLSEELGVPQVEGAFSLSRLEENINNRDSLLLIITDVYANADIYLKENERSGTAALIIAGGWIEALYISTNIINEEDLNAEIVERIAEQKFSVENLISLLKIHYEGDETLNEIFILLDELKLAYDEIEFEHQPGEVVTDKENKLTSINSKTQIYVNFDQINEIKKINDKLRELIIS